MLRRQTTPTQLREKSLAAALDGRFEPRLAREISRRAVSLFEDLLRKRQPQSSRVLARHLEGNIIPAVALYRAMRSLDIEESEATRALESVLDRMYRPQRAWVVRLGRLPFFYFLVKKLMRPFVRNRFPSPGWDTEWESEDDREVSFTFHSCFYLDSLRQLGAPELIESFCRIDDFLYEGASPHVTWAREGTLGRGDQGCRFRYLRAAGD